MTELGSDPASTLVIGDSPYDIAMGRAAGTRTAAALWGGASRERLLAEGPDIELAQPCDLLKQLTLFSGILDCRKGAEDVK
jgi:phosphoglycolate phosphatase-like HAD superfamily hydrolase